jgi:hypothetical protein
VKFFDSKYRLFGLVNIIDLVVIFAVLAGAYAIYRVLAPKAVIGGKAAAGSEITMDVLCPSQREIVIDQIHVGDQIIKNTTSKPFGTVTAVKIVPSPGEVYDQNLHKMVHYESTYAQDVVISVKATGQKTTNGVVIGDVTVHNGQPFPVMTSTYNCDTAVITNLKIDGKP